MWLGREFGKDFLHFIGYCNTILRKIKVKLSWRTCGFQMGLLHPLIISSLW